MAHPWPTDAVDVRAGDPIPVIHRDRKINCTVKVGDPKRGADAMVVVPMEVPVFLPCGKAVRLRLDWDDPRIVYAVNAALSIEVLD